MIDESNNVVHLPASPRLFRCIVCSSNIEESLKETLVAPRVFAVPDSEERFWVCGLCWTARNAEACQIISAKYAPKTMGDKNKNITSVMRGDKPIYRAYESVRRNSLGEKLKIVSWNNRNFGIVSVAVLEKEGAERLLMYNILGNRGLDHKTSIDHISKQYEKDYGLLEEVEQGSQKNNTRGLPWFRMQLLTLDCSFGIYEYDTDFGLAIGIAEITVPKSSFFELSKSLTSASVFLRTGTKDGYISRSKGTIVDRILPCGRRVAISGESDAYHLRIGDSILKLPTFDIVDLGVTCDLLGELVIASPTARPKLADKVRKQRYLWLHALGVPISFKMIMRDLGWFAEIVI